MTIELSPYTHFAEDDNLKQEDEDLLLVELLTTGPVDGASLVSIPLIYPPVLRIRIRDPVLFYPKDSGSGSGMIFFPDPGSWIPDPKHDQN
jgi:hypothetical protein